MPNTQPLNRRAFLGSGAAGIAFLARPERVLGANDRVRVGICGLRGRGMDHIQGYSKVANVEIAALCDVDDEVMGKALARIAQMGLPKPATYKDVRKLLDDKSIQAISVAAPNHWHCLMAVWACQAGKDAYVEKPGTHNLFEGQQVVAAAERYGRIVQHGTQSRSNPSTREMILKMRDLIGEPYMARGTCFKWRDTIGRAAVEPVPAGVDYDLWTGPAPRHDFTRNRFHYNWHWFWAYGNGDIGNQGVHQLDVARWGMGLGFPNKVSAIGGHLMFDDDQETPNVLNCSFEYDLAGGQRKLISFEVRHWISDHEAEIGTPALGTRNARNSNTVGDIFYGPKGYIATGDEDASTYRAWLGREQVPQPPVHGGDETAHYRNFIECVVSRKKENLNAPFLEGHISCAMMHLANVSYRVGRTVNFDPATQRIVGDNEADRLLRDGDRGYRAPFVVPEKV